MNMNDLKSKTAIGVYVFLSVLVAIVIATYSFGVMHSPINQKQVKVSEYVCKDNGGWSSVQNHVTGNFVITCTDGSEYKMEITKSGEILSHTVNTSIVPIESFSETNKTVSSEPVKKDIMEGVFAGKQEKKENTVAVEQVQKTNNTLNLNGTSVKDILFN